MVKQALRNGTSFLFQSQKNILSAAFIISAAYCASAILSFVRTRILSAHFGDSVELSLYFTADRIPSFIYSILVVGTLSTVFIPIFTAHFKKDERDAWRVASILLNLTFVAFLVLGVVSFVFSYEIMRFLSVDQFSAKELEAGSYLMRVMVASQIVLIVSSFLTSILQSFRYFVIPAIAPIVYNIGVIVGIVALTPVSGINGAAYSILIGSCLHLLVQLPLLSKIGFKYSFSLNLKDLGVKEVLRLAPPRLLASLINQLSLIIDTSLAILVSKSSVVVFKFAEQLQTFPVNLFGVSIALAALPTLSYESDDKDFAKFKETFLTSLHQMLFLVVPASIVLLVLRVPLVRLVYGASKFSWEATLATSYAVAFFSFSIFSQSAVYLINRAFYALHDTKTPLKVMLLSVPFDLALSVYMVKVLNLGVWSIALSYSISSILDFVLLLFLLARKVGWFDQEKLFNPFMKICYAAVFMGISLYVPMKLLERYIFDTTRTLPLAVLTLTAGVFGCLSYLLFTRLCHVKEVEMLYKVFGRFGLGGGVAAAVEVNSSVELSSSSESSSTAAKG